MVFDGDCGFCRRWIERWKAATGDRIDYAPSQEVGARFPEIPSEAFLEAVQLVTPQGEVFEGAEAVFLSLALGAGRGKALWAYRHIAGFADLTDLAYGFIARHRTASLRVTNVLWGQTVEAPTFHLANSLFLRLVGVCYLAAFVSLWTQIDGLVGAHGILPIASLIDAARSQLSGARFDLLPTLCWWNTSDGFLHFLCAGGSLAALAVAIGVLPVPALAICWLFYLSLCAAGQDFLEFQWDLLLLETGFLAIWLAPVRRWRLPARLPAPGLSRALLLWLLFRLMFSSGFVKLGSGDPNWRNLTALTFHYWTQPLPPWTAWYMAKNPIWFLKFSCFAMFAIELGAPFLILAPRRLRLFAITALAGFQVVIAATGNYAYFNLLAIALFVLLVDDRAFSRVRRKPATADPNRVATSGAWPRWVLLPMSVLLALLSVVHFAGTLRMGVPWPGPVLAVARAAIPFRSVGGYGLFAIMTTSRPEIILEGSDDAVTWKAYEFRWKPGDVTRRPRFVAPHQPRLDWQMWFAALGSYEQQPWFVPFCARLLEGEPSVTALLARNPFPNAPPRYLRAVVYEYSFTDAGQRRATGAWWKREMKGLYLPVLRREMLQRTR
jgi:predicted DCC family thiol-disulfide oxidoreductase YuxK